MAKIIVFWTVLFMSAVCSAEIIVDPNGFADFTTIQGAIDFSWDGDTVIVRPSIYNEAVKFNGRAITLTSLDPDNPSVVASTVITNATSPAVTFDFVENQDSILTGFTLAGGHSINGVVYCYDSSPTISKNIINSYAVTYAIKCERNAYPTISDNIISGGWVEECDGDILNNIFLDSSIAIRNGNNAFIYGNKIFVDGYGIQNSDYINSNAIIQNNVISGAAYGIYWPSGLISNNTIVNCDKGIYRGNSKVKNNIIAHNTDGIAGGALQISFNCFWGNTNNFIENAHAGTGDIIRDPLFAGGGDYHLKSATGRWAGTEWVLDDVNSPCIDMGDPSYSIEIEPNPNGGKINIGAYGGTAEASKSSSGIVEPVCVNPPSMDTNNDCKIDIVDFAEFASQWLNCGYDDQSACWE